METLGIDLQFIITHWPFCAFAVIMGVFGATVSDKVFTRSRAYNFDGEGKKVSTRPFWYWMRTTQSCHPIVAGALIGLVMPTPEPGVTLRPMIVLYYAMAGVGGLGVWVVIRAKQKQRELALPG